MKEGLIAEKKYEKPAKEVELPERIEKPAYHPVETLSRMAENAARKSESAYFKPGDADMHLKIAANADKLAECQTPIGSRFYQILKAIRE
ncbi:hypothetical protein H0O02_02285 [Candidatus Micrarchaeota archaeon]|nr:hypothetical protein [Candidatus Micrarchaeota archaeon]